MIIHCAQCQQQYPPAASRCPNCGANDMMIGAYLPSGTLVSGAPGSPTNLKIQGRDPETGRESPFLRHNVKEEYSSSRRQWEYVERIFNRLENSYVERYYDKQTGVLMFEKSGRRDDQSIHGPRGKSQ